MSERRDRLLTRLGQELQMSDETRLSCRVAASVYDQAIDVLVKEVRDA